MRSLRTMRVRSMNPPAISATFAGGCPAKNAAIMNPTTSTDLVARGLWIWAGRGVTRRNGARPPNSRR
jgi:hypothetical protein